MKRVLGLVAAVGLLAGSAHGQETYTIKIKEDYARGEKSRQVTTEKGTFDFKITDNKDNVLKEQKEESGKDFAFNQLIVDAKPGMDRPLKVERTYDKARVNEKGEKRTLPYEGKTVVIEKKGEKYEFRIKGGQELTGADAKALDEEFNKKGKLGGRELEKMFLPGKAVKVGETWKLDPAVLGKIFQEDTKMDLDQAKTTASGKLVKAYKKGDRQFGVLEFRLQMVPKAIREPAPVRFQPGAKMDFVMTLDVCIDGTSRNGNGTFQVTIGAAALLPDPDQPMFTLHLKGSGGGTYQHSDQ
ncbi:MAG: hypothetical protein IT429_17190 [Gemmataceae bacterium]|nr:hypothetical protein [Gemmataceae bacterium]